MISRKGSKTSARMRSYFWNPVRCGGWGATYLLEQKYHLTFEYYLMFFETHSCIPHFSISLSHHISLLAAVFQERPWPWGCKEGSSALAVPELALGSQAGARQLSGCNGWGQREEGSWGAWGLGAGLSEGGKAAGGEGPHARVASRTGAAGGSGAGWRGGLRPEGATCRVSSLCAHTASPLPVPKQRAGWGSPGTDGRQHFPTPGAPHLRPVPVPLCTRAGSPRLFFHLCAPYPFIECLLCAAVPRSTRRIRPGHPVFLLFSEDFPCWKLSP